MTRLNARTLDIALDPREDPGPILMLFRDPDHPMVDGEVFHVPHLDVEAHDVDAMQVPRLARFRFDAPLEDRLFAWFAWDGRELGWIAPPAIGASTMVGPR